MTTKFLIVNILLFNFPAKTINTTNSKTNNSTMLIIVPYENILVKPSNSDNDFFPNKKLIIEAIMLSTVRAQIIGANIIILQSTQILFIIIFFMFLIFN